MCNLYRNSASAQEVARLFGAAPPAPSNAPPLVYPGRPGFVAAGGVLQSMVWGFPKALISKKTGKPLKPRPVNNARCEHLMNPRRMWHDSFVARRCLIPVSAFAEAEGEAGSKTRTWISLPEQPVFAIAGVWRETDEWGRAYSMVMTDVCLQLAGVHDRMPVILQREDWSRWSDAPPEEARALCVPYAGSLTVDRTDEPWFRG
jgi:putative SOS response-associated peptidase YedK